MQFVPVHVVGRVERRRRFTAEQKLAIVAEALSPGASVSAVARKYDLLPSQVFKWRRLAELGVIDVPGVSELPSLVGAEVASASNRDSDTAAPAFATECCPAGMVEVELASGVRVRITGAVSPAVITATLAALAGRAT